MQSVALTRWLPLSTLLEIYLNTLATLASAAFMHSYTVSLAEAQGHEAAQ